MPRLVCVAVLIAFAASWGFAQTETVDPRDKDAITKGEFAQMVLDIALGYAEATPDPVTSLERMKTLGIVPATWVSDELMTHQDLADVCHQIGIEYLASKPDAPVSGAFVAALLHREVGKLRDYTAKRLGHGFSANHVLDAGVDRAVSPSDFD
jgi:hypothetical protein